MAQHTARLTVALAVERAQPFAGAVATVLSFSGHGARAGLPGEQVQRRCAPAAVRSEHEVCKTLLQHGVHLGAGEALGVVGFDVSADALPPHPTQ
eukprot:365271-Chlamydomonas_euryale.AAC.2